MTTDGKGQMALKNQPMNTESQSPLSPPLEAERIYAAIFGRPIPAIVAERFRLASERINHTVPAAELASYHRSLAACRDLEALEVAARYARRSTLLSRKFRLMAFLAETLPENQDLFVNTRSSLIAGLFLAVTGTLRTIFKLLKGLWLLGRAGYA